MRARGGAWSVVGWSVGNALIMEITPPMIAGIGWATFVLFAGLNFLAIPFVWAFYPETSNKTLEELDIVFSTKSCLVWKAEKELERLRAEGGDAAIRSAAASLASAGGAIHTEKKNDVDDSSAMPVTEEKTEKS